MIVHPTHWRAVMSEWPITDAQGVGMLVCNIARTGAVLQQNSTVVSLQLGPSARASLPALRDGT
jgi:hypothetical protein